MNANTFARLFTTDSLCNMLAQLPPFDPRCDTLFLAVMLHLL